MKARGDSGLIEVPLNYSRSYTGEMPYPVLDKLCPTALATVDAQTQGMPRVHPLELSLRHHTRHSRNNPGAILTLEAGSAVTGRGQFQPVHVLDSYGDYGQVMAVSCGTFTTRP